MYRVEVRILYVVKKGCGQSEKIYDIGQSGSYVQVGEIHEDTYEELDEVDSCSVDIESIFEGAGLIGTLKYELGEYKRLKESNRRQNGVLQRSEVRNIISNMSKTDREWFEEWYMGQADSQEYA